MRESSQTISVSAAVTAGAANAPAVIPLDHHIANYNVGYAVVKTGTGDMTYAVQGTLHNVLDPNVTPTYFDIVSAKTDSFHGNTTVPYAGIRISFSAVSGAATANFIVRQAGN